jgi:hypothetical protein
MCCCIQCYTAHTIQALFKYYDIHGDAVLASRLHHVSPTFKAYVTEQLQLYKNTTATADSNTAAVSAAAATDAAADRRTALMSRLALDGSNRSNGEMLPLTSNNISPFKLSQLNVPAAMASSQYRQSEVVSSFGESNSPLTAAALAAHIAATSGTAAGVTEPSQLSDIRSRLQRFQKPLANIDGNTTAAAAVAAVAAPKQQQQQQHQQAQISSSAATLRERLARLTQAKNVL